MKKSILLLFSLLFLSIGAHSQSKSYQALKNNFDGKTDVHSFKVGGFFCRMVLGMAGEWEFNEAIKDIEHVRLITIPSAEFARQDLSVKGFKKLLRKDSFEELASIKDNGDDVTIFLQSSGKKSDCYIVVIEGPSEIVVVELKGTIDVKMLMDKDKELALQNH